MAEDNRQREGAKRFLTVHPAPAAAGWTGEAAAVETIGGDLGLVLWKGLRRVRLWADTEPDRREGLFPPATGEVLQLMAAAAAQAPELLEAIGVFAGLLRAPHELDEKQVARACGQVYAWADARGLSRVAMHFAEAAAAAEPANPTWAVDAGWMCRRGAVDDLMERSAAWYERAFGLAVRAKNRREVIRSLTEYGALLKDLGRYDKARACYERAALRALRTGRPRQAAVAYHYLLGLVVESGCFSRAERYTRLALEHYPLHDPRIPYLAHDFAFLLIRRHLGSLAAPLLDRILPIIPRPEEQVLVYGSVARAAGGLRRRDRFDTAERQVLDLVGTHDEFAPSALNGLAEGARVFGRWKQAEQYAAKALEIARSRKDLGEEQIAVRLMEEIARRDPAPREGEVENRDRLEALVRRLTTRLQR